MKYLSYKHIKEFIKDLKTVYKAKDEQEAMYNLDAMEDKW
jgi:transposase-like protein